MSDHTRSCVALKIIRGHKGYFKFPKLFKERMKFLESSLKLMRGLSTFVTFVRLSKILFMSIN